jgi:soluble lytic murein transglycosylase-like protein
MSDVKSLSRIIFFSLLSAALSAQAEINTGSRSGDAKGEHPLIAQSSLNVFKYTNRQGVTSFSDRAPAGLSYRVVEIKLGCYACDLDSKVDWHRTPLHLKPFRQSISTASSRYGIDPALIRAVIHAESAFRSDAKSRAGALGLMQLMPATARELGVADPLSPHENIQGGTRYLAQLLKKTRGNITTATAAYNAGPGAVERFGGIPPYKETETYVKRVNILHDRYRKALSSSS